MSDDAVDFHDLLFDEDHMSPDDLFRLPENMSNSSLWNHTDFFDMSVPHDPHHSSPVPPKPEPLKPRHHSPPPVSHVTANNTNNNANNNNNNNNNNNKLGLNTSPVTTRFDGPSSTADTYELNNANNPASATVQPLTTIVENRPILTHPPRRSLQPTISKTIAKNNRLSNLTLRLTHPSPNINHTILQPKLEPPLTPSFLATADHKPLSNSPAQQRPDDDSRERHNKMMRENRCRFNKKFKELTQLLDFLKEPSIDYNPMKNKIQILERAIYQYARMKTRRARFQNELLFSPERCEHVENDFLKVFTAVPTLPNACQIVIENMCATLDWKYGEAWIRKPGHTVTDAASGLYKLHSSVISENNMPDTRILLERFSKKSSNNRMDDYLLSLSQHRHAVWIPNLSKKQAVSRRGSAAKEAHLSTMFMVPIYLSDDAVGLPDAILTLMHVNDELLSFPSAERPYDPTSMTKLMDLVAAVVKSRSKISC